MISYDELMLIYKELENTKLNMLIQLGRITAIEKFLKEKLVIKEETNVKKID